MKKYISDVSVWFLLGIFFFFVSSYGGLSSLSLKSFLYHAIIFAALFPPYFLRFRRPRGVTAWSAGIYSLIAFLLPSFIWEVLTLIAISRGSFSL
jgi:hypothetical protein